MSYIQNQRDIEAIFNQDEWKSLGIQTVPQNWQGSISGREFVRVGVYPTEAGRSFGDPQIRGFVLISIFTDVGEGEKRSFEIADHLDSFIQARHTGSVQTYSSTLQKFGIDQADPSLWRMDYRVTYSSIT